MNTHSSAVPGRAEPAPRSDAALPDPWASPEAGSTAPAGAPGTDSAAQADARIPAQAGTQATDAQAGTRTDTQKDAQANTQTDDKRKSVAGQAAMRRLSAPVRTRLRVSQVLVVVSAVLAVAPYVALAQLGDVLLDAYHAGTAPDPDRVWHVVMVLVSAYSTRLGLYFVALLATHLADLSLRDHLRRDIVARLSHVPLSWFTASTSGRVRKAVQDDTTTVHTVIAHGPVEMLNAVVSPLALLAYAFWIDWRLALLALVTVVLYILTYSLTLRGMNEKTVEMDRRLAEVSSSMVEFVSGIFVVKAFGRVGRAHTAYLHAADGFSSFYRAWALPLISISCLSFTWVSVPVVLLVNLGGGALLLHAGAVTLPQVLVTTLIALVLPGAIITVASISWSYQMAGAAALRLCEILDVPVLSQAASPGVPESARVEIDHVSFSYGRTLALDDVTLTLEPGTVTALLGPSGSGKSTLATLIARFSDPDTGAVRIGGVDLREMEEQTLYDTVSFVLQDAQLLSASVRDNIALGRPGANLEEVRSAARVAQIDDVIMALPHGYDTVIGRETSLSGGQEQRVAIARAVLADNPVLLLDEATAMADPESEAEIQRALSALVRGRTVLVIAHRPGAVRGADRIVVMDRGRVVAAGRHEEIVDEPHYQALLRQGGLLSGPAGAGQDDVGGARGRASQASQAPRTQAQARAGQAPRTQARAGQARAGRTDPASRAGQADPAAPRTQARAGQARAGRAAQTQAQAAQTAQDKEDLK